VGTPNNAMELVNGHITATRQFVDIALGIIAHDILLQFYLQAIGRFRFGSNDDTSLLFNVFTSEKMSS
jgi:hypothetical protein